MTLAPSLWVALVPDLLGTLEPCGCTRDVAGGLDRVAAAIAASTSPDVPALKLASGPLFARSDSDHGEQDVLRADGLSAALARLAFDAVLPSPRDLREHVARLTSLSRTSTQVIVPRSVPELPAAHLSALLGQGDLRIGVLNLQGDLRSPTARDHWYSEVSRLRAQGARIVLVTTSAHAEVVSVPQESGAELLFVSTQGAQAVAEQRDAKVQIAGGFQAEGFWSLELWLTPVRASSVPLRLVAEPPEQPPTNAHLLRARYLQLDASAPRDPELRKLIEQVHARIDAHNAASGPLRTNPPKTPGGARARARPSVPYVGSQTCAACHTQAYFWWLGTPHGRAYESLRARGRKLDLDCIGCHLTGFDRPGGASLSRFEHLQGVGCESCHGPGGAHADDPRAKHPELTREVAESTCLACHDPAHSEGFVYARGRDALLTPVHGRPRAP